MVGLSNKPEFGLLTPKKSRVQTDKTETVDTSRHLNTPDISPEKLIKSKQSFNNDKIIKVETYSARKILSFDEEDDEDNDSILSLKTSPSKRKINYSTGVLELESFVTSENNSPAKSLSSSSQTLLSSPLKKSRSNNRTSPFKSPKKTSTQYADRHLPNRTGLDKNVIDSISKVVKKQDVSNNRLSFIPNGTVIQNTNQHLSNVFSDSRISNGEVYEETIFNNDQIEKCTDLYTEHFVEIQKKRQSNQVFDVLLKNEIFGSKLDKISDNQTSSLDVIRSSCHHKIDDKNLYGLTKINEDYLKEKLIRNDDSVNETDEETLDKRGLKDMEFINDSLMQKSSNKHKKVSILTYKDDMDEGVLDDASKKHILSPVKNQLIKAKKAISFAEKNKSVNLRNDSKKLLLTPVKKIREVSKIPYRVLDAPGLADDFYLNLVDWSKKDWLGVILDKKCFLTHEKSGDIIELDDLTNHQSLSHSAIKWSNTGEHLALGLTNGITEVYDIETAKPIRTFSGHVDRVGSLSWNNQILTTGSRDSVILHRDMRVPNQYIAKIKTHEQEVCGLTWNVLENKLASGGNDNLVFVYDGLSSKPTYKINEHKAAVKALCWSPHASGVLATGGGSADKFLKIWNVNNGTKIKEVDTGSQICNIVWSSLTNEIVTSHGFSKFHLTCWDYEKLQPLAILKGHTFRILHLALSSDGTTVVSGAGDETLRFWKIFNDNKKIKNNLLKDSTLTNINLRNKQKSLNKIDDVSHSLRFLR
ncbi:hypothetical protein QEN19_001658 [Hanseniaspora menglaensis]